MVYVIYFYAYNFVALLNSLPHIGKPCPIKTIFAIDFSANYRYSSFLDICRQLKNVSNRATIPGILIDLHFPQYQTLILYSHYYLLLEWWFGDQKHVKCATQCMIDDSCGWYINRRPFYQKSFSFIPQNHTGEQITIIAVVYFFKHSKKSF